MTMNNINLQHMDAVNSAYGVAVYALIQHALMDLMFRLKSLPDFSTVAVEFNEMSNLYDLNLEKMRVEQTQEFRVKTAQQIADECETLIQYGINIVTKLEETQNKHNISSLSLVYLARLLTVFITKPESE